MKLDIYDNVSFEFDPKMGRNAIFHVFDSYPYRTITIDYGDNAIANYNKKQYAYLRRKLTHEMVHKVLDELDHKWRKRSATSTEWLESLETAVEHITAIIEDLR